MTAECLFEAYSKQVCLIVEWMSEDRRSSTEDRSFKLKTACEQAVVDLSRDLQELTRLQVVLTNTFDGLPMSRQSARQAETYDQRVKSLI